MELIQSPYITVRGVTRTVRGGCSKSSHPNQAATCGHVISVNSLEVGGLCNCRPWSKKSWSGICGQAKKFTINYCRNKRI